MLMMLLHRKRGKIHYCFLAIFVQYDIWCLMATTIISMTLWDLYHHFGNVNVIDQGDDAAADFESVASVAYLQEVPTLPEFDGFPQNVKNTLHQVYDTTYKEIAKCRLV